MKFKVWGGFPDDFFETMPAAIYDIVAKLNFFIFEYQIVGNSSNHLEYTNPFSGASVSAHFPGFGSGLLTGVVVDTIEKWFNISIHVTFFDVLIGPLLIIALGYAFIKFLIPTNQLLQRAPEKGVPLGTPFLCSYNFFEEKI